MLDLGSRNEEVYQLSESLPVHSALLTSAPQRSQPVSDHLFSQRCQSRHIAWDGVIGEVTSHHPAQPSECIGCPEYTPSPGTKGDEDD